MDPSLNVIERFLRDFAPEVAGRSSTLITPEMQQKLRKLSAGELAETERRTVARELLANQQALDFLLAEIRKRDTTG